MTIGKEPQFGVMPEKKESLTQKFEKLQGFIKEISDQLKKEGIPINEKERIDMGQFYSPKIVEADRERLKSFKERWNRVDVAENRMSWVLTKDQILKQTTVGEAWEMLATVILHKNLGKDFIIVRSSKYDDAMEAVDHIIIDKKTGNIICAFDDVKFTSSLGLENKQYKVKKINQKGGASLKYGIFFEKKNGVNVLKKGRIDYIPLFYFASSEDDVRKGLECFSFSRDGQSDDERKIFQGFIDSFNQQIDELKKYPLHPKFKERLDFFEAILKNMVK